MPVGERGLLDLSELTPQELRLCAKAAEGSLLDLRSAQPDENDPSRGRAWGPARRIRAQVLFQLLTGYGPQLAGTVVAVRLAGAQLVGRLNLGGWTLRCPLDLTGCHVHHRLDLAKAQAPNVSLRLSHLHSGLSARRLQVQHTVNLSGMTCRGRVDLAEAHISGQLDCHEATFTSPDGIALNADRLVVDGSVHLSAARCAGQVRFLGATIIGQLNCSAASFDNPAGIALGADGLTASGGLSLTEAQLTGETRLLQAVVGMQLGSVGARFTNPGGLALYADGLSVNGSMFMNDVVAEGEVRLAGAHVTGQLSLIGAGLSHPDEQSLFADRLIVDSELLARDARFTGEVRLLSAHVVGQLDCSRASFGNPGGNALAADTMVVDGNLFLLDARFTGRADLSGARISGQLNCDDARFSNPGGIAVGLEQTTVGHAVLMRPEAFDGGLDLFHARVGAWHDRRSSWPSWIRLEGFVYDAIHAPDVRIKDRLGSWLARGGYAPQPYEQLAGVYRREGDERAARTVSIAEQRARRANHHRWWIRWPAIGRSAVLRWSIGYGYRPALALIPLAVLVIGGSVLFQTASLDPAVLHPAKPGTPEQPGFDAFRFTMDLLLPVATFKQRDTFVVDGWAAWAAFGFTFAGWLLAAIVVAGLAGVFKRD